jgi:hypothetical protein
VEPFGAPDETVTLEDLADQRLARDCAMRMCRCGLSGFPMSAAVIDVDRCESSAPTARCVENGATVVRAGGWHQKLVMSGDNVSSSFTTAARRSSTL